MKNVILVYLLNKYTEIEPIDNLYLIVIYYNGLLNGLTTISITNSSNNGKKGIK